MGMYYETRFMNPTEKKKTHKKSKIKQRRTKPYFKVQVVDFSTLQYEKRQSTIGCRSVGRGHNHRAKSSENKVPFEK